VSLVGQHDREAVRITRSDGLGVDPLRAARGPMLILSTARNPVGAARAEKLRIAAVHGIANKGAELARLIAERGVAAETVVYVGNDTNHLGCMELAGFPVAVADAHPAALLKARHVLGSRGGAGAVRELADLLLDGAPAERGAA